MLRAESSFMRFAWQFRGWEADPVFTISCSSWEKTKASDEFKLPLRELNDGEQKYYRPTRCSSTWRAVRDQELHSGNYRRGLENWEVWRQSIYALSTRAERIPPHRACQIDLSELWNRAGLQPRLQTPPR